MQPADIIIINAGQLLTMQGPKRARAGEEMNDVHALADAAVAIRSGRIVTVGSTDELTNSFDAQHTIDAQGRLVLPGFVDPHTHLVFAGTREHEMARKAAGETYLDILKSGGGINATVRATRKADKDVLFDLAMERLDMAAMHGTTTIEIKSGYGLEPDAERKMLEVINELALEHVLDIVPSFLGAHMRRQLSKSLVPFFDLFEFSGSFQMSLQFDQTACCLITVTQGQIFLPRQLKLFFCIVNGS